MEKNENEDDVIIADLSGGGKSPEMLTEDSIKLAAFMNEHKIQPFTVARNLGLAMGAAGNPVLSEGLLRIIIEAHNECSTQYSLVMALARCIPWPKCDDASVDMPAPSVE